MKNLTLLLKNSSIKPKIFGKIKKMGLEKIVPAISLVAVLILVLPAFLSTNTKLKVFLNNLSIWAIIVLAVMILSYLI